MSMGQTMLAVAFFVLLTVAVINADRMIMDSDQSFYQEEATEQATNYANALLGEISKKRFDENIAANDTAYHPTTDFTPVGSLGIDNFFNEYVQLPDTLTSKGAYESIKRYDDVDDYNGYERIVRSPTLSGAKLWDSKGDTTGFILNVKVYYVTKSQMNVPSSSRQYLKRVDVSVYQKQYLPTAIKFSTIVTY
jgi:hypothetical protein